MSTPAGVDVLAWQSRPTTKHNKTKAATNARRAHMVCFGAGQLKKRVCVLGCMGQLKNDKDKDGT